MITKFPALSSDYSRDPKIKPLKRSGFRDQTGLQYTAERGEESGERSGTGRPTVKGGVWCASKGSKGGMKERV